MHSTTRVQHQPPNHPAADSTPDQPTYRPAAPTTNGSTDQRPKLLRDDCPSRQLSNLGTSLVQSSGSASEQPQAGCVGLHCNTELV